MRKLIESYNNGYGPGNGGNGNGAPGSGNNGGNGNNSNGGSGNGSPKRPSILMLILSGLMTVIVVLMLYNAFFGTNTGTEVSYTDFLKDLEADKVAAVEVNKESGMVTVQLKQEAAPAPAPGSYGQLLWNYPEGDTVPDCILYNADGGSGYPDSQIAGA